MADIYLENVQNNILNSKQIIDSLSVGIAIFNIGSIIPSYVNPAAVNIMGCTKEDFINDKFENYSAFFHPDDDKKIKACMEKSAQACEHIDITFRFRHKDGVYKWLQCAASLSENKKEYFVSIVDISVQKYAQEQSQLNEERLRITLSHISDVMFDNILEADITEDKLIGKNCDSLADLLKIPHGSSYTDTINAISNQLTRPDFAEEYRRVLSKDNILSLYNSGTKIMQHECIERSDGINYTWIRVHYCIYKSEISGTVRIISYVKNIEDEKNRAYNLIAKAQNTFVEYESITEINISNDTYIRYNTNVKNKSLPLSGCFSKEISTYAQDIIDKDERAVYIKQLSLANIIDKLKNEDVFSVTYTVDENKCAKIKKAHFFYLDSTHKTICFTITDVTEIVIKEQEKNELLSNALTAAEQANMAKSKFFSNMSHDMRTPMNGIIGLTELTKDMPNLPAEARANLNAIDDSAKYLLSLINDTLDMNKIENSKFTLNPQVVHSGDLIQNIIAVVSPLAKEKNISLEVVPINVALEYIRVDKIRAQQIFINVLSNAVKFTPNGGKIKIVIECLKCENGVAYDKISVEDTGIGMSEEFLMHLHKKTVVPLCITAEPVLVWQLLKTL